MTLKTAVTKKTTTTTITTKGTKKVYLYYGNRNIPMKKHCYIKRTIGNIFPSNGFLGSNASAVAPPDGFK